MPRRRELADAADGISGHFMFDSPANPDWPLAHVANAVRAGGGTSYSFDLLSGETDPPSEHIASLSTMLQRDLARHLDARHLPLNWVGEASVDVTVGDWSPGQVASVRCQVRIVDDLETVHTSTRRGQMTVPRGSMALRLREWFHRNSS
jgi:hypothetical protein